MRTTPMLFAVVVFLFSIDSADANQPSNGMFNTNLSGWTTAGSWSSFDANGAMSSGSLLASNIGGVSLAEVATTCIPYLPSRSLRVRSKAYIPAGQAPGSVYMAVRMLSGLNCTGGQVGFHYLDADEVSATGVWDVIDISVLKDPGAVSTQLIFVISKSTAAGTLQAYLDDVVVSSAKADSDASGTGDVIWRNYTAGSNSIWLMNGGAVAASAAFPNVNGPDWGSFAGGDFQGDGKADLLWRNGSIGATVIWYLNGTAAPISAILPSVPSEWYVAAIGDFQNDGKSDIVWRNSSTGANVLWLMDGGTVAASAVLPTVSNEFYIAAFGDYQGDGKTDLFWSGGTANVVWLMDGTTVAATGLLPPMPATWYLAVSGDFQGDGKDDLFWRNETSGENMIWFMNGLSSIAAPVPAVSAPWRPVRGSDFQGDMKADVFWRNDSTGSNVIWFLDGAYVAAVAALPPVSTAFSVVPDRD